jgi:hypothetical protein
MSQVQIDVLRCPYCHDSLANEAHRVGCGSCLAWHHRECLTELGACASCGDAVAAEELDSALSRILERTCHSQGCPSTDTIQIRGSRFCLSHGDVCPSARRVNNVCMALIALLPFVLFFTDDFQRSDLWTLLGWVLMCGGMAYLRDRLDSENVRLVAAERARRATRASRGSPTAPLRSPQLKA